MSARATIELRGLVTRDDRLLLVREASGRWEPPGGAFAEDADDIDAAMDSLLRGYGIASPDIAEDFYRTVHLPSDEGSVVVNFYVPLRWVGEPATAGGELDWFGAEQIALLPMRPGMKAAILETLGEVEEVQELDFQDVTSMLGELEGEPLRLREALAARGLGRPGFPPGDPLEGMVSAAARPLPASDRHAAGLDVLRTLSGGDPEAAAKGLQARTPEIADDIINFALGEVWARPELDRRTRSLEVVAMLAAMGGRGGPLRSHINGALNHGATPAQVVETLRMVAVYAGFPAALEAWPVMEEVFKARGIPRPGAGP
jgi:4-carboxymuconolactone decarboxylase